MKTVYFSFKGVQPNTIENIVKDILKDYFDISFEKFSDSSVCGNVIIECHYSYGYMQDKNWCGICTLKTSLPLKGISKLVKNSLKNNW